MATDLSLGSPPATHAPGTWSADGRTFTCTTSLDLAPGLGDLVVLTTAAGQQLLGQVGPQSDVEELVAHDLAFHHRIASIGGNEFLCDLLDVVAGRTSRVRVWRGITQEGAIERTLGEHAQILAALQLHDPALTSARLTAHVSGVEDWVRRALP